MSASALLALSANHRRRLAEQDLALLVGVDSGRLAQFGADGLALDDRRPLAHRFLEPLVEGREVLELLPEILEANDPWPDRHVGDRKVAGYERAVGEPLVEHAEQAVDLVAVAVLAVLERLGRIELRSVHVEVVGLPRHRAE